MPPSFRPCVHVHPGRAADAGQSATHFRLNPALQSALESAIAAATGQVFSIRAATDVSGGCIHRSLALDDGTRRFFAKTNEAALADAFAAEADGLHALSEAGMRVPRPIGHGTGGGGAYLILEYLDLRRGRRDGHVRLGRALAALHAHHGEAYGWGRDNYIGPTPQSNTRRDDWAAFWVECRLRPQLQLAALDGHRTLQRPGESLCERVSQLLAGYKPPASLLHGDLWSGNAAFLADGTPVLFDPAVYWGDREADIAMTELFGGFDPSFYAAYREAAPLDPGYAVRKALYNLYHILNHAHLFGGGYVAQAGSMMLRLLAETNR